MFIEENSDSFSATRMRDMLDVSARGLRAYRSRPASQKQRTDMVVLAHMGLSGFYFSTFPFCIN